MVPDALQFGKYFSLLFMQEQNHMESIMQKYGLNRLTYPLLVYLSHNEGLNQRNLCKVLLLNESLANRTMRTLEADGFISRERDAEDKRSYILHLTTKGKEIAAVLADELDKWWSDVLQPLNDNAVAVLAAQMAKISQRSIDLNHAIINQKSENS